MLDISKEEFERQKAESAKRIRELYRGHSMPPYPEFVKVATAPPAQESDVNPREKITPPKNTYQNQTNIQGILRCFNMGEILKSPDSLLILGLILLLLSDSGDEKLILALIFIML